ncbi:MAG: hypothetical protein M1838_002809 [Thelocarpon superellum]|nr:MAG: hypothetical protein M1838_002809 [Thelocarpon superellum]
MPGARASISTTSLTPQYVRLKELTAGTADPGVFNGGVWTVARKRDGRRFVEKLLPTATIQNGMAERECIIIRSLIHRNVLRFVDAFIDAPGLQASLYTDHCDLGNLDEVIRQHARRREPVPEGFARHVMTSLTNALAFCHAGVSDPLSHPATARLDRWLAVVHRDLKPGNVFLTSSPNPHAFSTRTSANTSNSHPLFNSTPNAASLRAVYPRVVLGDFGCCIRQDSPGYDRPLCAGALYIQPPETPKFSEQGDIWALGAVMQMLCRRDGGPLVHRPPGCRLALTYHDWMRRDEAWNPLGAGPVYTQALNYVVGRCQELDRRSRPYATQLAHMLDTCFKRDLVLLRPLPSWSLPGGAGYDGGGGGGGGEEQRRGVKECEDF